MRDIRRTFRQTLWLVAMLTVPLVALLWNTGAVLVLLGQDARLAALAQDYIRAYLWSIPIFLVTMSLRNFLSALERPLWSLVIGIIGAIAGPMSPPFSSAARESSSSPPFCFPDLTEWQE